MKFILAAFAAVILSLFIGCTTAKAQTQIVSDTSYLVNRNDTLFQVKETRYVTGKRVIDEEPIGQDSISIIRDIRQQAYTLAQQFAYTLYIAENEKAFRRTIAGYSDIFETVAGRTLESEIDLTAGLGDSLLGNYILRIKGIPVNASIIRNPSGAIRFRVNNTNYPVDLYSELLFRVRNFDDGAEKVDFYFVRSSPQDKKWSGGFGRYILIKN